MDTKDSAGAGAGECWSLGWRDLVQYLLRSHHENPGGDSGTAVQGSGAAD